VAAPVQELAMDDWRLPWTGGCRCDGVRFEISAAPLFTAACHCTGCRRMSASAFSLSVAVPAGGFAVTRGETVIGGLHGEIRHYFCPHCMSWMYTRPPGFDFVNVRATLLDDHAWYAPYVETYTSEKLAWATTGAPRAYERFPAAEDVPELLAGFARDGARPRAP
jgi:hypothetical protein